jgi:HEAT repeat protein
MPSESSNLSALMLQLRDQTGAIPFSSLYAFSDLSGEHWAVFQAAWATFSPLQRQRLVRALIDLAEASFEVNFDAIFRHTLYDEDPDVRAMSIDGLWENEDVRLIGPMLTMLRADPSERVRAAAASGLGRYVLAGQLEELPEATEARIVSELLATIHLAGESIEVRRRALESVAYACTPEVLAALEMAYYDPDEDMRISAITGMGRSCDKRWRPIILEELTNTTPAVRYEAAWASGEMGLRSAVPLLADLIYHPDLQVSIAAIWALGQIGGGQAKEVLLAAYEDADAGMRDALDEALAEHALSEGDLEFELYSLEHDLDDHLEDEEFFPLWSADEDMDDFDQDEWESQDY